MTQWSYKTCDCDRKSMKRLHQWLLTEIILLNLMLASLGQKSAGVSSLPV